MKTHAVRSFRAGLTLIEIIVVMGIIGVLVALVLPAVNASREAARRVKCLSNLRQIGIGIAGHLAARGHYPSALVADGKMANGRYFALSSFSAHVQILPYLEQEVLFNHVNFTRSSKFTRHNKPSAASPANLTVLSTALELFLCPSDPSDLRPGNNYRASSGPHPSLHEASPWLGGGGAFPGFDQLIAADFKDGLSTTVGFSERTRGGGPGTSYRRNRDLWFSGVTTFRAPANSDEMAANCNSLTITHPSFCPNLGETWIVGTLLDTIYNHAEPPNWSGPDCSGGHEVPAVTPGVFTARSGHAGGVHVLFMDGSARFVGDRVSVAVWRAISTRSGGETVSADAF